MFRPLLNITAEFTAEDLEAALITPNDVLDDVHMPLLKVGSSVVQLELVPSLSVSLCVGEGCVCVHALSVSLLFCCILLIAS